MFMMKSTHFILQKELINHTEKTIQGLKDGKVSIYMDSLHGIVYLVSKILTEKNILQKQVDNLEKQLKEAKRRQSNGRFVSHNELGPFSDDFLTRS